MARLSHNFVANFAGKAWATLIALACVPVYLRVLGVEAYGVIGIYLTLHALASVLDLGLGTTLNRQLARLSRSEEERRKMREILAALEFVAFGSALIVGVGILALAPLIATGWVKPGHLAPETIQDAIVLMGLSLACQWPATLYAGGLAGLERQIQQNLIAAGVATFRHLGAVFALLWIGPDLHTFFAWQIIASVTQSLVTRIALVRAMPARTMRKSILSTLRSQWGFASGVTAVSFFSVVVTQVDKVVLSRMVSLDAFGHYMLAIAVASAATILVPPVYAASFPRFSQLVAEHKATEVVRLYHGVAQVISAVTFPLACTVILFSRSILTTWTGFNEVGTAAGSAAAAIAASGAVTALMYPAYAVQLAHGWLRPAMYLGALHAGVGAPLAYICALAGGGNGVALGVLGLNVAICGVNLHLVHRRLLSGELREWATRDTLPVLAAVLAVTGAVRIALPDSPSVGSTVALIAIALVGGFLAAIASAPAARRQILAFAYSTRTTEQGGTRG